MADPRRIFLKFIQYSFFYAHNCFLHSTVHSRNIQKIGELPTAMFEISKKTHWAD